MQSKVVTFIHEFGHIMHGLCAKGVNNSTRLSKWTHNFVQSPSQIKDIWIWRGEAMGRLIRHHNMGKILPDHLVGRMIWANHVNLALGSLRQIYLIHLNLTIHSPKAPLDVGGV